MSKISMLVYFAKLYGYVDVNKFLFIIIRGLTFTVNLIKIENNA